MRSSTWAWLAISALMLVGLRVIFIDENGTNYAIAVGAASVFYWAWVALSAVRGGVARLRDEEMMQAFREAHKIVIARRQVRAHVPKSAPRREDSVAAHEGAVRITSARSIASLIRRARVRETALDLCDLADMVLETIRRMPADTPSAYTFCDVLLSSFYDTLERMLKTNASNSSGDDAALDRREMANFAAYIHAFRRQQENIIFEGRAMAPHAAK